MKYTEISVGDKQMLTHVITHDDIVKFVELTGDDNKLHIDEDYARKTNFKKPVVHGMLGASFISTIIGTKLPGDGALWFSQSLEFLLPVRVGDKLEVSAEVLKKYDKDNIIELKTEIHNQNRQVVTRGIAKVKVIEQEIVADDQLNEVKPLVTRAALVIGGTGGIGSEVCIGLAKEGFDVAIHYNTNIGNAKKLKTVVEAAGRRAVLVSGDISNADAIHDLIAMTIRAFGKIDVFVNCSSTNIPNIPFRDLRWEDYSKQIDLYIKSTFLLLKEIVPHMLSGQYGKIICIGSMAVEKPNSDWSHYITAKAAQIGFIRSLAFELAPRGIRVNMVTPSLVNTEMTADISEKQKLLIAAQTPLRKLALTTDVANAVCFLASPKSDFITGENIRLNGGQIML